MSSQSINQGNTLNQLRLLKPKFTFNTLEDANICYEKIKIEILKEIR